MERISRPGPGDVLPIAEDRVLVRYDDAVMLWDTQASTFSKLRGLGSREDLLDAGPQWALLVRDSEEGHSFSLLDTTTGRSSPEVQVPTGETPWGLVASASPVALLAVPGDGYPEDDGFDLYRVEFGESTWVRVGRGVSWTALTSAAISLSPSGELLVQENTHFRWEAGFEGTTDGSGPRICKGQQVESLEGANVIDHQWLEDGLLVMYCLGLEPSDDFSREVAFDEVLLLDEREVVARFSFGVFGPMGTSISRQNEKFTWRLVSDRWQLARPSDSAILNGNLSIIPHRGGGHFGLQLVDVAMSLRPTTPGQHALLTAQSGELEVRYVAGPSREALSSFLERHQIPFNLYQSAGSLLEWAIGTASQCRGAQLDLYSSGHGRAGCHQTSLALGGFKHGHLLGVVIGEDQIWVPPEDSITVESSLGASVDYGEVHSYAGFPVDWKESRWGPSEVAGYPAGVSLRSSVVRVDFEPLRYRAEWGGAVSLSSQEEPIEFHFVDEAFQSSGVISWSVALLGRQAKVFTVVGTFEGHEGSPVERGSASGSNYAVTFDALSGGAIGHWTPQWLSESQGLIAISADGSILASSVLTELRLPLSHHPSVCHILNFNETVGGHSLAQVLIPGVGHPTIWFEGAKLHVAVEKADGNDLWVIDLLPEES